MLHHFTDAHLQRVINTYNLKSNPFPNYQNLKDLNNREDENVIDSELSINQLALFEIIYNIITKTITLEHLQSHHHKQPEIYATPHPNMTSVFFGEAKLSKKHPEDLDVPEPTNVDIKDIQKSILKQNENISEYYQNENEDLNLLKYNIVDSRGNIPPDFKVITSSRSEFIPPLHHINHVSHIQHRKDDDKANKFQHNISSIRIDKGAYFDQLSPGTPKEFQNQAQDRKIDIGKKYKTWQFPEVYSNISQKKPISTYQKSSKNLHKLKRRRDFKPMAIPPSPTQFPISNPLYPITEDDEKKYHEGDFKNKQQNDQHDEQNIVRTVSIFPSSVADTDEIMTDEAMSNLISTPSSHLSGVDTFEYFEYEKILKEGDFINPQTVRSEFPFLMIGKERAKKEKILLESSIGKSVDPKPLTNPVIPSLYLYNQDLCLMASPSMNANATLAHRRQVQRLYSLRYSKNQRHSLHQSPQTPLDELINSNNELDLYEDVIRSNNSLHESEIDDSSDFEVEMVMLPVPKDNVDNNIVILDDNDEIDTHAKKLRLSDVAYNHASQMTKRSKLLVDLASLDIETISMSDNNIE